MGSGVRVGGRVGTPVGRGVAVGGGVAVGAAVAVAMMGAVGVGEEVGRKDVAEGVTVAVKVGTMAGV